MAKYMDVRSGFTGRTADQLRRAVGIDYAGAGHLDWAGWYGGRLRPRGPGVRGDDDDSMGVCLPDRARAPRPVRL